MEENPESSYTRPPSRPNARKLSKAPSWVMLGFLIGAAFVWLLPESGPGEGERPVAGSAAPSGPDPARAAEAPERSLTTIEAVFEQWGQYAVWEHDITQVALWNAARNDFTDCYEVVRSGEVLYFRSLPKLTRPVINYGGQITSPLQYTETEAMRAARARGMVVYIPGLQQGRAAGARPAIEVVESPAAGAAEPAAAPTDGRVPAGRRLPVPEPGAPKAVVTPPPMLPTPQAKPLVPPSSVIPEGLLAPRGGAGADAGAGESTPPSKGLKEDSTGKTGRK